MKWLRRLRSTLRPNDLQRDLDDELQFHIDRRADELIAQGMAPDQARREAAQRFGNRTLQQERARDRDIVRWLETLFQDLRYAARTMRRNPGFALTAVLSLALGIGANAALFSIMDALLLKQLPVHDPKSLVVLARSSRHSMGMFEYGVYESIRKNTRLLTGVAAMSPGGPTIEEDNAKTPARVEIVSGNYFDVLGVAPQRGRVFHDASEPIAVISDSFWRSHYGSGDVIGKKIKAWGAMLTIAGVSQDRFRGDSVDWPTDVWVPLEQVAKADGPGLSPNWAWLQSIARLAPGATMGQVHDEAEALQHAFLEDQAGTMKFKHESQRAEFYAKSIVVKSGASGLSNCGNNISSR